MKQYIKYSLFFALTFLIFSCSSHKQTNYNQHIPPEKHGTDSKISDKRKIIVQHAIKSLGLPYKWGGTSPETGFDCSGLMIYTYNKAHIALPRTAKAQLNKGKPVLKDRLQAADLVFFKPPQKNKPFHVGVYIGDGLFVHSPGKNREVRYDYLNNPYFKKHYIGARKYF